MIKKRYFAATAGALALTAFLSVSPMAAESAADTKAQDSGNGEAAFSIGEYDLGQAMTEEKGIALALEHAGLTPEDVERQRSEYDREDGMEVLEAEFMSGDDEYSYDLDLEGGRILKASYEMSDRKQRELTVLDTAISDTQAADLVLEMVPDADADDMWIEADRDDGIFYYEIAFTLDGVEYSFDVDADAGVIVSWEQEIRNTRR